MSAYYRNRSNYLRKLYKLADQEPLSKYEPGRAQRIQSITRGHQRAVWVRRAEAMFLHLTRKERS